MKYRHFKPTVNIFEAMIIITKIPFLLLRLTGSSSCRGHNRDDRSCCGAEQSWLGGYSSTCTMRLCIYTCMIVNAYAISGLPRQIYKEDPCLVRQTARLPKPRCRHAHKSSSYNLGTLEHVSQKILLSNTTVCHVAVQDHTEQEPTDLSTRGRTAPARNTKKHDFIFGR